MSHLQPNPPAPPAPQPPAQPLQMLGQIMQDMAAMVARQAATQGQQLAMLRQQSEQQTAAPGQLLETVAVKPDGGGGRGGRPGKLRPAAAGLGLDCLGLSAVVPSQQDDRRGAAICLGSSAGGCSS